LVVVGVLVVAVNGTGRPGILKTLLTSAGVIEPP
jgi:hypothetical protein